MKKTKKTKGKGRKPFVIQDLATTLRKAGDPDYIVKHVVLATLLDGVNEELFGNIGQILERVKSHLSGDDDFIRFVRNEVDDALECVKKAKKWRRDMERDFDESEANRKKYEKAKRAWDDANAVTRKTKKRKRG